MCGKATVETRIISEFEIMFEGVMIQVKDAEITECPNCGERSYGAKELKRWKKIKEAQ
jgi:ribosomal protein S27AE